MNTCKLGGYFFVLTVCAVLGNWTAAAQDPNPPTLHSSQGAWKITRQWTPAETQHYAKWMENIYKYKTEGSIEQRMAKLDGILTDPQMNLLEQPHFLGEGGNPQLSRGLLRQLNAVMDCGKFTIVMPAYYAYRRGLPWMVSTVASGGGDIRIAEANIPVGSVSSFTSPSLASFFNNAVGGFISGNYRVELNGRNAHLSDTVPVAITKEHCLPGIANYLDGHCLLLGAVSPYGELRFINASTTKTRDIYTYNGMNCVSGITPSGIENPANPWDGCYQGMRVWRYPIAETDSKGRVIKVRRRTDEEMKPFGFSTEQYTVMQEMYSSQQISLGDIKPKTYHDFVRLRMMSVDKIKPLEFLEQYTDELLDAYKFREQFVQDAWRDVLQNGPIVYPEMLRDANIFQAHGRWETWSSPSSDVDRRNKYFYLADWIRFAIDMFGIKPGFVDLSGLSKYDIRTQADLAKALLEEKKRLFAEHSMQYKNSRGDMVTLTLQDIEDRLFDLSFDPNHPPELRWGAPKGSEERASAPSRSTPLPKGGSVPMEEAYALQAYYRSVGTRETEMSMLRGMFTEGYPVLDKVDVQVARCFNLKEPTEALEKWLGSRGIRHADRRDSHDAPVLMQARHNRNVRMLIE